MRILTYFLLIACCISTAVAQDRQPFVCGAVLDVEETKTPYHTKNTKAPQRATESNAAVTIDILALYTPAAEAVAIQNNNNIDTLINESIQRANLVMQNSNTGVTFNLVHKQQINYVESSSTNTDLERLRNIKDDKADEAHALRARYNADMVVLVIGENSSKVLGAGYILANGQDGSSSSAFSVVKVKTLTSGYTMIHEIGHNFGCGHHTETDNRALYDYSHGWKGTLSSGDKFCTVMTYESSNSGFFPRIPYFSDPNISFGGTPVGDKSLASNAKTIRQTKELIAAYSDELPKMDNFLKNIELSAGTLSPAFNPGIRQYTVSVPDNVTKIDVKGKANVSLSSVRGNVSGYALNTGSNNVITIEVEDLWGNSGVRTYTVTVIREKPQPVTIDKSALSYTLPQTVNYNGQAHNIDVTPKKAGLGAITVKYNGDTTVPVNAGEYEITVDVSGTSSFSGVAGLKLDTLTVAKADIQKSYLQWIDVDTVLYNETGHTVEVTFASNLSPLNGFGSITVLYNGNSAVPVQADTYVISAQISEGLNFNSASFDLDTLIIISRNIAVDAERSIEQPKSDLWAYIHNNVLYLSPYANDVAVMNVSGQRIFTAQQTGGTFDMSRFASGIYLVILRNDREVRAVKVVK
ncbi:MAG: M12 family metallo-peptidase [Bacteroidales bacterium]|nr:M12 family metallo-peptidase [Bacteroidales bacterium]